MRIRLDTRVMVMAGRAVTVGSTVIAVGAAVGSTAVKVKMGWAGLVACVKVTTILRVLILAAVWLELPNISELQPCDKPSSAISNMT